MLFRMVEVKCDSCGDTSDDPYGNAEFARHQARKDGWHCHSGRDICPTCWEEGAR
jgi:hypothetical protein